MQRMPRKNARDGSRGGEGASSAFFGSLLVASVVAVVLIANSAELHVVGYLALASGVVYFGAASDFARIPGGVFDPWRYFLLKTALVGFLIPLVIAVANEGDLGTSLLPMQEIDYVILVLIFFYSFAWIGMRSGIGHALARQLPIVVYRSAPRPGLIHRLLGVYVAAWVARLLAFASGLHQINADLGTATTMVSSVLMPFSQLGTVAFFTLIWLLIGKGPIRAAGMAGLVSLVLIESMFGFAMGSKSQIILPTLYVLVCWSYLRRPVRPLTVLSGLIVLMFVLVPVLDAYRQGFSEVVQADKETSMRAIENGSLAITSGAVDDYDIFLKRSVSRIGAELEGLVVVVDQVPSRYDYQLGATFFPSMLYNLIPRIFWPDKPIFIPGREFSALFWDAAVGETYATNQDISWIGEAYFNFGLLGVGVAFLLGILIAFYRTRLLLFMEIEELPAPRVMFVLLSVLALSAFHYYLPGLIRSSLMLWFGLAVFYWRLPTFQIPTTRVGASRMR